MNPSTPARVDEALLRAYLVNLPADTLAHLAALAREREDRAARGEVDTWARDNERLAEQARIVRVAEAMLFEDGFPAGVVADALVALKPAYADVILEALQLEAMAA